MKLHLLPRFQASDIKVSVTAYDISALSYVWETWAMIFHHIHSDSIIIHRRLLTSNRPFFRVRGKFCVSPEWYVSGLEAFRRKPLWSKFNWTCDRHLTEALWFPFILLLRRTIMTVLYSQSHQTFSFQINILNSAKSLRCVSDRRLQSIVDGWEKACKYESNDDNRQRQRFLETLWNS